MRSKAGFRSAAPFRGWAERTRAEIGGPVKRSADVLPPPDEPVRVRREALDFREPAELTSCSSLAEPITLRGPASNSQGGADGAGPSLPPP